jgi:hypothetical protein
MIIMQDEHQGSNPNNPVRMPILEHAQVSFGKNFPNPHHPLNIETSSSSCGGKTANGGGTIHQAKTPSFAVELQTHTGGTTSTPALSSHGHSRSFPEAGAKQSTRTKHFPEQ